MDLDLDHELRRARETCTDSCPGLLEQAMYKGGGLSIIAARVCADDLDEQVPLGC